MTEAELYAPDLDEGELDVEEYVLPSSDDPYLAEVFKDAQDELNSMDVEEVSAEGQ